MRVLLQQWIVKCVGCINFSKSSVSTNKKVITLPYVVCITHVCSIERVPVNVWGSWWLMFSFHPPCCTY